MIWPIFNTLQLLTSLLFMDVSPPANITFFKDIILDIVNFQVVDKDEVYSFVTNGVLDAPSENS